MTCEELARVSVPVISNQNSFLAWFESLARTASSDNRRSLLMIEAPDRGSVAAFHQWGAALMPVVDIASSRTDRNDLLAAHLGTEHRRIAVDATGAIDVGAIATLCGTVTAGGVFCILLHSLRITMLGSRFGRRFGEHFLRAQARHPTCVLRARLQVDVVGGAADKPSYSLGPAAPVNKRCGPVADESSTPQLTGDAEQEQNDLLTEMLALLSSEATSAIALKGRRGRGKSFLLGRFARAIEGRNVSCSILTVQARPARSLLAGYEAVQENNGIGSGEPVAPPPRMQLRVLDPGALPDWTDVIIVDEAASFPITTLQRAARSCRLLLLATTVDGHEAAGRGFELQFLPWLESRGVPVVSLTAEHPWRWRAGCPLEQWLNELLILPTTLPTPEAVSEPAVEKLSVWHPDDGRRQPSRTDLIVSVCDRDRLARNESDLRQLYTLLLQSHYQSTSLDLQHLLDAHGMGVCVARQDGVLLGAAMTVREGGISGVLHTDIVRRQRRLAHQRLPQQLAQCLDDPTVLGAHYVRVVRIAVLAPARRSGVASAIVRYIESSVCATGNTPADADAPASVSALGASFGASTAALAFWNANGFTRFHDGFRTNPRSGLASATVLKAFAEPLDAKLQTAARLREENAFAKAVSITDLRHGQPGWVRTPSETDIDRLRRFAGGERQLMDTRAALCRLWLFAGAPGLPPADSSDDRPGGWLDGLFAALGNHDVKRFTRGERDRALRQWVDDQLQRLR